MGRQARTGEQEKSLAVHLPDAPWRQPYGKGVVVRMPACNSAGISIFGTLLNEIKRNTSFTGKRNKILKLLAYILRCSFFLPKGPSLWYKSYPIAQGSRQSPIDIISTQAMFDPSLKPLSISYGSDSSLGISNNGHSVMVDFKDVDDRTAISGGPLENPYRLKQFHFHWGTSQKSGSEHTINGKSFPCEQYIQLTCLMWSGIGKARPCMFMFWITALSDSPPQLHLVHWNAKKYTTFGEAVAAPDGLAVGEEHTSMNRLTDAFYMVKFKGTKAEFRSFNPSTLLPPGKKYWTYAGSLTTPPLHESVTWIVLKEAIQISEKQTVFLTVMPSPVSLQMEKFRSLLFSTEEDEKIPMVNNFRPPQPLKGRVVRASFK
ncbi:Carbonic anhydrase 7, partial [Ophiophagus hannah]